MSKRIIAVLVLLGVIAVLVVFTQGLRGSDNPVVPTTRTADPEVLKLFIPQSINFYADNYQTGHIYGEVRNTSDTDAVEVVLELKVYDKERNLVKKLKVTVRDVPSGQVRSFDVPTGVYQEAYTAEAQVVEVAY